MITDEQVLVAARAFEETERGYWEGEGHFYKSREECAGDSDYAAHHWSVFVDCIRSTLEAFVSVRETI